MSCLEWLIASGICFTQLSLSLFLSVSFSSLCSWGVCRRWLPRCRHRWRWREMSEKSGIGGGRGRREEPLTHQTPCASETPSWMYCWMHSSPPIPQCVSKTINQLEVLLNNLILIRKSSIWPLVHRGTEIHWSASLSVVLESVTDVMTWGVFVRSVITLHNKGYGLWYLIRHTVKTMIACSPKSD